MGVAAGVSALDFVVGSPKIMDQCAAVVGENVGHGESFNSAFGTVTEVAVSGGAGNMQPVSFSDATHSGFIAMKHGGGLQNVADGHDAWPEKFGTFSDGLDDAAGTGAVPEKVLTNFRSAGAGDDLTDIEVAHDGAHPGSVLGRGVHISGKFSSHGGAAVWASFYRHLMLGDLHFDGWKVENLASFQGIWDLVSELSVTFGTAI